MGQRLRNSESNKCECHMPKFEIVKLVEPLRVVNEVRTCIYFDYNNNNFKISSCAYLKVVGLQKTVNKNSIFHWIVTNQRV